MILESMEVTKEERALIRTIRKVDEVVANVVLWYGAGLEESARKIQDIDPWQANISREKARYMNQCYRKELGNL